MVVMTVVAGVVMATVILNAHYDYYGDGDSDDDHADVTEKCDAADEGGGHVLIW